MNDLTIQLELRQSRCKQREAVKEERQIHSTHGIDKLHGDVMRGKMTNTSNDPLDSTNWTGFKWLPKK